MTTYEILVVILLAVIAAGVWITGLMNAHNTDITCDHLNRTEGSIINIDNTIASFKEKFANFCHDLEVWTKSRSK